MRGTRKGLLVGGLVALLVFGTIAFAIADTVTYPGTPSGPGTQSAQGSVSVNATVNPKITLTITTPDAGQSVSLGAVDPGGSASKTVDLTVQSNKAYDLSVAKSGTIVTNADLGFTTSLAGGTGYAKPGQAFSDTYSIAPTYNADPGVYSGTVQYTVAQQ